jgi:hypothetical protein
MKVFQISMSLLFISLFADAQQYLTFPIHGDDFRFNWKAVEKSLPRSDIDRFIHDRPRDFYAYRQKDNCCGLSFDSLYNDLHFLDLNGDGKNDVVFDGQTAGEPREIEIFINSGNHYKKAFSVIQGIVKMDWEGDQLSRIYIRDWGCCDADLEVQKIYDVHYDKTNYPIFAQIYQSVVIYHAPMPDSMLETPIQFEVLNQAYNIRSAPQKDDTSYQHWNNDGGSRIYNGNVVGKIVKGATGMALAKTVDNSGREWLYVEIDKEELLANDIIYAENKFPTKLKGWISGRFVKLLSRYRKYTFYPMMKVYLPSLTKNNNIEYVI